MHTPDPQSRLTDREIRGKVMEDGIESAKHEKHGRDGETVSTGLQWKMVL